MTIDTKTAAVTTMPTAAELKPLPGVAPEAICQSRFDVNDLALTGKKAVTVRQFNQPLVMADAPMVRAGEAKAWLLGQKLDWAQEWRHEGLTLGEPVSSLSHLPAEELTIEVSSFQRTQQEIQREDDETKRRELLNEQRTIYERAVLIRGCTAFIRDEGAESCPFSLTSRVA